MWLSLVARVTGDSWTACAVLDQMDFGLGVGDQLAVATTLCKEVHDSGRAIVIEKASADPVYRGHHTPQLYRFESYIAIPIHRSDGQFFGTLCALDREPAQLDTKIVDALSLFSELISHQLIAEQEQRATERALLDERELSELREQFIAILGHDLRNPLGAMMNGAQLLSQLTPRPEQEEILELMLNSGRHMSRLIDDVLDLARGRLGGGIPLHSQEPLDLATLTAKVVEEMRSLHPQREFACHLAPALPTSGDRVRLRQLLTNLIGNALEHSPACEPVTVVGERDAAGAIRLEIRNGGPPISSSAQAGLFKPFANRAGDARPKGLGLGLYIAAEIVRAHGGAIAARSDADGTVFTVTLPAAETAG